MFNIKVCNLIPVSLAVMLCACGNNAPKHGEEHEHEHEHEEGVIVLTDKQVESADLKFETVKASDFSSAIRVSGQVLEAQGDEMAIVARSSGVVTFVRDHLAEGTAVKAGEAIAQVSAKGLLGGDDVAKAHVDYETARLAFERAKKLMSDTIISRKEYERIKAEYEKVALGNKGMGAAGSSVNAPSAGFVRDVLVNPGEYVEAGQKLMTMTRSCKLQLRAEAPEKHFLKLKDVSDATFVMAYETEVHRVSDLNGHLVSIGRAASEGSAYIPVTFEFENDGHLVPGAFADIWLITETRKDVISVPASAITEEQGLFFVYVQADHHNEFEKIEVRLGGSNGERVEILDGIKVGDKVVVNGVYQVKLAGASGAVPEAHSHEH